MFDLYDLFESVDIIVDKRVKAAQSQMDRTLVCSITQADRKQYGEYTVNADGAEIVAYCSDTTYEVGDVVYVGVPANDFTSAYIIAKKLSEADIDKNVSNPFNNYFKMIVNKQEEVFDYNITDVQISKTPLAEIVLDKSGNYNALGIEGEFWTHFDNIPRSSSYGLLISVQTDQNTVAGGSPLLRSHSYSFGSEKMIGQVFNYIGGSTQRILIDLQGLSNIVAVKVYSYFFNNEPTDYIIGASDYIKVKNLEVSLGHVLQASDTSGLIIYTSNSLTYNNPGQNSDITNSDLNKTLYARWIYKDKDTLKAITHYNIDDFPKIASLKWQIEENGQWLDIANSNNQFVYALSNLDKFKLQEKIRAIVTYFSFDAEAPEEYISNEIVFQNAQSDYANIIVDKTMNLLTDIDDFSAYYGPDGSILDYGLGKTKRKISFKAYAQDIELDDTISISVNWKFNIANSMIIPWGFDTNSLEKEEPTAQDTNYYIYTKTIWSKDIERPQDGILTGDIYFSLINYYTPAEKNNDIICEIVVIRQKDGKEQFLQFDSAIQSFKFRRNGVCQTDKILQLTMRNPRGEEVRSIIPGESVMVEATIYDCNGNIITPVGGGIQWSWWYAPEDNQIIDKYSVGDNRCSLISTAITEYENLDLCYILEAKYEEYNDMSKQTVTIKGYFPIALNLQSSLISYCSGPNSIYYNSAGGNPSYYNEAYRLYLNTGTELKSNISWHSYIKGIAQEDSYSLYPTIGQAADNYYLIPKLSYTKNADSGYCVYGLMGDLLLWVQPIIILQTNSFSSFINEWDGSFSLDEANNQLMSARLGAGRKNDDNTFSGVLLGDWTDKTEDGSISITGVYGFDRNIQSYGLREDGSAFFGKAGAGRINFNGDLGVIYSGNFDGKAVLVKKENLLKNSNYTYELTHIFTCEAETTLGKIDTDLQPVLINDIATNNCVYINNLWIEGNGENYCDLQFNFPDSLIAEEKYILLTADVSLTGSVYGRENMDGDYLIIESYDENKYEIAKDSFIATCFKNYDKQQLLFNSQEEYDNTQRIFKNAHFVINIIVKKEKNSSTVNIPFFAVKGILDKNENYSLRVAQFNIANIQIREIDKIGLGEQGFVDYNNEIVFNAKNKDENAILSLLDIGNEGTFIDLKQGGLVTNNGTFRGTLIAEDLIINREITLGNEATGEYITLGPNGVKLGQTVIVQSGGGSGSGCNCDTSNFKAGNITFSGVLDGDQFSDNFIDALQAQLDYNSGDDNNDGAYNTLNVYGTLNSTGNSYLGSYIEVNEGASFGDYFKQALQEAFQEVEESVALKELIIQDDNGDTAMQWHGYRSDSWAGVKTDTNEFTLFSSNGDFFGSIIATTDGNNNIMGGALVLKNSYPYVSVKTCYGGAYTPGLWGDGYGLKTEGQFLDTAQIFTSYITFGAINENSSNLTIQPTLHYASSNNKLILTVPSGNGSFKDFIIKMEEES